MVGSITLLTWIALTIVASEMVILAANDWECPLTIFAEHHGAESGSVADLFLPRQISDHLFQIFGILFGVICVLLFWRLLP
ncbi:MAG: hypothetical protein R3281_08330 [Balneolaceae bacterium]|nr:hypothetical protein [Balneolaceae bacterium]